eukprot:Skav213687  [mRNA]  locus=scaffold491:484862:485263:- [translate_table: standard]
MNMPMFVPDSLWLARLWPKQVTNYGHSHPNLHQQLRLGSEHPSPYPSLDDLPKNFPAMLYWAYYSFLEMPGVQVFASIPHLLWSLNTNAYDLEQMSLEMKKETSTATKEVLPFWAALMEELTADNPKESRISM